MIFELLFGASNPLAMGADVSLICFFLGMNTQTSIYAGVLYAGCRVFIQESNPQDYTYFSQAQGSYPANEFSQMRSGGFQMEQNKFRTESQVWGMPAPSNYF